MDFRILHIYQYRGPSTTPLVPDHALYSRLAQDTFHQEQFITSEERLLSSQFGRLPSHGTPPSYRRERSLKKAQKMSDLPIRNPHLLSFLQLLPGEKQVLELHSK